MKCRSLFRHLVFDGGEGDGEAAFARFMGVDAHAVDPGEAARLWALSAERTGVDAFS